MQYLSALLTAVQHELVADNEVEPLAGIGPLTGALEGRDAGVWREIEQEIERRNASGYDRAAELLSDLQALAAEEGSQGEFARRLGWIRAQHESKRKFIERLTRLEGDLQ